MMFMCRVCPLSACIPPHLDVVARASGAGNRVVRGCRSVKILFYSILRLPASTFARTLGSHWLLASTFARTLGIQWLPESTYLLGAWDQRVPDSTLGLKQMCTHLSVCDRIIPHTVATLTTTTMMTTTTTTSPTPQPRACRPVQPPRPRPTTSGAGSTTNHEQRSAQASRGDAKRGFHLG